MDALSGGENVSQCSLSERLDLGLGVVHRMLRELVEAGYLGVVDETVQPFAYRLTRKGGEYRRRMSHRH